MIDTTKPVDRMGNSFCGPLVVAAIIGTSTGAVADMIKHGRAAKAFAVPVGRKRRPKATVVRGTYENELFALLEAHGARIEPIDVGSRYIRIRGARGRDTFVNATFTRWAASFLPPVLSTDEWYPCTILEREALPLWRVAVLFDTGTYIVNTPNHWAIASDGKWCETYTKGEWVPLRNAPGRNRKVLRAWRVS